MDTGQDSDIIRPRCVRGGGGGYGVQPPPFGSAFVCCFVCLSERLVMYDGYPYILCVWKMDPKCLRSEKSVGAPPPPTHQLFQAWRGIMQCYPPPPPPRKKNSAYANDMPGRMHKDKDREVEFAGCYLNTDAILNEFHIPSYI